MGFDVDTKHIIHIQKPSDGGRRVLIWFPRRELTGFGYFKDPALRGHATLQLEVRPFLSRHLESVRTAAE